VAYLGCATKLRNVPWLLHAHRARRVLKTLLWKNVSVELAKVLTPGIDGLQTEQLDNGVIELTARRAGTAASPPEQHVLR
jgi:hypothetical protein